MRERPILFSAPMVRALLAGTKTQTRRVCKPMRDRDVGCDLAPNELAGEVNGGNYRNSSYQPGDRLWVRENHYLTDNGDEEYAVYAADSDSAHEHLQRISGLPADFPADVRAKHARLRPSIHMPRWASRILLEVTDVRVERLQDISEADAIAEGIDKTSAGFWSLYGQADTDGTYSPRASYRALWESINGAGSWAANPWIWAVEFRVLGQGGEHAD